jgi:acetyltransferase-like isoleucine patch superfamily enzyme
VEFEGWNSVEYNATLLGKCRVGAYSTIGAYCTLFGGRDDGCITVGRYAQLGPGVSVWAVNHGARHLTTYNTKLLFEGRMKQFSVEAPIIVGDDVWIGANSILLPGVTVGNSTIIGAGSVDTKSIPPYSVAVGNPARVIRRRFTPEIRLALDEWQWWRYTPEDLLEVEAIFRLDMEAESDRCLDMINRVVSGRKVGMG